MIGLASGWQGPYFFRFLQGGSDEYSSRCGWVTQMLRQTDAKVFKKYSQMKLQMKREALTKLDRSANEKW
jgi:hypothetical protein